MGIPQWHLEISQIQTFSFNHVSRSNTAPTVYGQQLDRQSGQKVSPFVPLSFPTEPYAHSVRIPRTACVLLPSLM